MKWRRKLVSLFAALLLAASVIIFPVSSATAADADANTNTNANNANSTANSTASAASQVAQPVKGYSGPIKLDLHHILIDSKDGNTLQVTEVLKVNNTSKETYTGTWDAAAKQQSVLKISMPQGYTNLRVDGINQSSVVANADNIITTAPLNPGATQISLSYQVLMQRGQAVIAKAVDYPTDVLYVLSPKAQLVIKADGITDYGVQSMEGQDYHVFYAQSPPASQQFTLTASPNRVAQGYQTPTGFHSASHLQWWADSPLRNTNPHLWVAGIIVFIFALIAGISRYLRRKARLKKSKAADQKVSHLLDDLVIQQKRLLDEITMLEQKKESGEINEEEFELLNKQYRDKLVKTKLKIKKLDAIEI